MDGGADSDSEEGVDRYTEHTASLPGGGEASPISLAKPVLVGEDAMRAALHIMRETGAYGPGGGAREHFAVAGCDVQDPSALLAMTEDSCRTCQWPLVFFGFLAGNVGVGLPGLWPPMRESGLAPVRLYNPRGDGHTARDDLLRASLVLSGAQGMRGTGDSSRICIPRTPGGSGSPVPGLPQLVLDSVRALLTPWHMWSDDATGGTVLAMQRAMLLAQEEQYNPAPGGARVASQLHLLADAVDHVIAVLLMGCHDGGDLITQMGGLEGTLYEGMFRFPGVLARARVVACDVGALALAGARPLRSAMVRGIRRRGGDRIHRLGAGNGSRRYGEGRGNRGTDRDGNGADDDDDEDGTEHLAVVAMMRSTVRRYHPGFLRDAI